MLRSHQEPFDYEALNAKLPGMMEVEEAKDNTLKLFRVVCSHGPDLAKGVVTFRRCAEWLADVGVVTRSDEESLPGTPESSQEAKTQFDPEAREETAKCLVEADNHNTALKAEKYRELKVQKNRFEALKKASECIWREAKSSASLGYRTRRLSLPDTAPDLTVQFAKKEKMSVAELTILFNQCRTVGQEGLRVKGFTIFLLRLAQIHHSVEFSNSCSKAVLMLFHATMTDFIYERSPQTETDVGHPLQAISNIPNILRTHSVLLRRLFLYYATKQVLQSFSDLTPFSLNIEQLNSLLSDCDVVPKQVSHGFVYEVFFEQCKQEPGKDLCIDFDSFVNCLIRIGFKMYLVAPHHEKLPTVAARLYCLLVKLTPVYSRIFQKPFTPLQDKIAAPELHSIDPVQGEVSGGYNAVLYGSGFDESQGVYVTFENDGKKVICTEVKPDLVRVVVPPCSGDVKMLCSILLQNQVYGAKITFTRTTQVRVSNDAKTFSSGLTFTYTEHGGELSFGGTQTRISSLFTEYAARKTNYQNDKYLGREAWDLIKKDFGLQEVNDSFWFDHYATTWEGASCLTFRRFLLVLVSIFAENAALSNPTDRASCSLVVSETIRSTFGAENAASLLLRTLSDNQSSLTMQKVRQLNSVLAVLNISTTCRRETSPDDALLDDESKHAVALPFPSGEIVNVKETRSMLVAYLKSNKDAEARSEFEKWRTKQTKDRIDPTENKPTADAELADAIEQHIDSETEPAHAPPEVHRDLLRYESTVPKGGHPWTPALDTIAEHEENYGQNTSVQVFDVPSVKFQMLGVFVKLAYDRVNQMTRRFYITEGKLKSQINELRENMVEKEEQVKQLREYATGLRQVSVTTDVMEKELFAQTYLKIEKEIIEKVRMDRVADEETEALKDEEAQRELLDAEREKVINEFSEGVQYQDGRFYTLIKLLANQTQWLESQKNIVIDLQSQLRIFKSQSESYKQFVIKLRDAGIGEEKLKLLDTEERKMREAQQLLAHNDAVASQKRKMNASHTAFEGATRQHVIEDLTYKVESVASPDRARKIDRPVTDNLETHLMHPDLNPDKIKEDQDRAIQEALREVESRKHSEQMEMQTKHHHEVTEIKQNAAVQIKKLEEEIFEKDEELETVKETVERLRQSTLEIDAVRFQEQLEAEQLRVEQLNKEKNELEATKPTRVEDIVPDGAPGAFVYITQEGDTLVDLAEKFDTNVSQLLDTNTQLEVVFEDEVLPIATGVVIPLTMTAIAALHDVHALTRERRQEYVVHMVASTDTLSALAEEYGVSCEILKKANFLPETGDIHDPSFLSGLLNKKLRVPHHTSNLRKSVIEVKLQANHEAEKQRQEDSEKAIIEKLKEQSCKTDMLLSNMRTKQNKFINLIRKTKTVDVPKEAQPGVEQSQPEKLPDLPKKPDPLPLPPPPPLPPPTPPPPPPKELQREDTRIMQPSEEASWHSSPPSSRPASSEPELHDVVDEVPVSNSGSTEEEKEITPPEEVREEREEQGKEEVATQVVVRGLTEEQLEHAVQLKSEAKKIRGGLVSLRNYVSTGKQKLQEFEAKSLIELGRLAEAQKNSDNNNKVVEKIVEKIVIVQKEDSGESPPSPSPYAPPLITHEEIPLRKPLGFGHVPVHKVISNIPQSRIAPLKKSPSEQSTSEQCNEPAELYLCPHGPFDEDTHSWVDSIGFPLRSHLGFTAFTAKPPPSSVSNPNTVSGTLRSTKFHPSSSERHAQDSSYEQRAAKLWKRVNSVQAQTSIEEHENFEKIKKIESVERTSMSKKMLATEIMAERIRTALDAKGKLEYRLHRVKQLQDREHQINREAVVKTREAITCAREKVYKAVQSSKIENARVLSNQKITWSMVAISKQRKQQRQANRVVARKAATFPLLDVAKSKPPPVVAKTFAVSQPPSNPLEAIQSNSSLTAAQKSTLCSIAAFENSVINNPDQNTTATAGLIKNFADLSSDSKLPWKRRLEEVKAHEHSILQELVAVTHQHPRAWTPQPRMPTPDVLSGCYVEAVKPFVPALSGSSLPKIS